MTKSGLTFVDDVPLSVEAQLRAICLELPDAYEQRAWKGVRWMVRTKTFANVLGIEDDHGVRRVVLAFRSSGDELEVLCRAGHPFLMLGWGRDAVGLILDDTTDWAEVEELITESYCVMAPQKLVALVDRPPELE